MIIKIKTSVAGLNFSYQAGQTVDVEEELAKDLIRAGYAEPAKAEIETAAIEAPENTARAPAKKRR